MGILVNLYLNNSFRPVKHAVKAPHFCGMRVVVAVSAKKERRKKIEGIILKRIIYCSASLLYGAHHHIN